MSSQTNIYVPEDGEKGLLIVKSDEHNEATKPQLLGLDLTHTCSQETKNSNHNNSTSPTNSLVLKPTSPVESIIIDVPPVKSIERYTQDKLAMSRYLYKPVVYCAVGVILCLVGIVLTFFHFNLEDSSLIDEEGDKKRFMVDMPFYCFGPIAFATGSMSLIFGMVFFSVKKNKWMSGKASPIMAMVANAMALSARPSAQKANAVNDDEKANEKT